MFSYFPLNELSDKKELSYLALEFAKEDSIAERDIIFPLYMLNFLVFSLNDKLG